MSRRVLLAVDDAQWADEPSLRFLGYLARRLEALPIAVLVGVRTEDARPSSLEELGRDRPKCPISP
jgi:predicted ATPase